MKLTQSIIALSLLSTTAFAGDVVLMPYGNGTEIVGEIRELEPRADVYAFDVSSQRIWFDDKFVPFQCTYPSRRFVVNRDDPLAADWIDIIRTSARAGLTVKVYITECDTDVDKPVNAMRETHQVDAYPFNVIPKND